MMGLKDRQDTMIQLACRGAGCWFDLCSWLVLRDGSDSIVCAGGGIDEPGYFIALET